MKVIINDNIFKVKVCMTPETISKGMMGQKFNSDFNGMLFMMPNNGDQSFWMKNCLIPLDIVFIGSDKKVTSIQKNCKPCNEMKCPTYEGTGQYVLELDGGTCDTCGIEPGQKMSITL
jgi:uncharacterized membrane protein (UPF0127 family)